MPRWTPKIFIHLLNDSGSTTIEEPIPPELENVNDKRLLQHKYCKLRGIDPEHVEEFEIR